MAGVDWEHGADGGERCVVAAYLLVVREEAIGEFFCAVWKDHDSPFAAGPFASSDMAKGCAWGWACAHLERRPSP